MLDAGVVDQNIDPAKGAGGIGHHGLDLCRTAHVGAVVGHPYTKGGKLGAGALRVAKAVKQNVGALCCEGSGEPEANAAGGARNECCFAFEHADSLRVALG